MATITEKTILKSEMVIPLTDGGKIVLGSNGLKIVGTKKDVQTPSFILDGAGCKGYDDKGTLVTHWDSSTGEIDTFGGKEYVPQEVRALGIANGLLVRLMGAASTSPTLAEVRAKYYAFSAVLPDFVDLRTPDEGGTFVDDGSTMLHVGCLACTTAGAEYLFTSSAAGRWYFEWRLKNSNGWSKWSCGEWEPSAGYHYVDTTDPSLASSGPPSDWAVSIKPGPNGTSFYVEATRPIVNGGIINSAVYQFKDASTGSWVELDGASPAVVHYDGSAVAHSYNVFDGTLTKASGDYGDAATYGGLLLIDVRGGAYDVDYCLWVYLQPEQVSGVTISGLPALDLEAASDLRLKIVKPPNEWSSDGYQALAGLQTQAFYTVATKDIGLSMSVFRSDLFLIPAGVSYEDLEARVWFENDYSISNGGEVGSISTTNTTPLSNELPLGVYKNFADGRYWERILIPKYPLNMSVQSDRIDFYMNNFNYAANSWLISGHPMGLKFRPTLRPDTQGEITVIVTVNNLFASANNLGNCRLYLGLGVRPSGVRSGVAAGSASEDAIYVIGAGADDALGAQNNYQNTRCSIVDAWSNSSATTPLNIVGSYTYVANNTYAMPSSFKVRYDIYWSNTTHGFRGYVHGYPGNTVATANNWVILSDLGFNYHNNLQLRHVRGFDFYAFCVPALPNAGGNNVNISGSIVEFEVTKGIIIGAPELVGQYQPDAPIYPATPAPNPLKIFSITRAY